MTAALLAGLLAGCGIAIPIGAIVAYLVTLTAHTSLQIGASAAFGVATADGLYALIAVLGGSALTRLIEPIAAPMRLLAAAVLLGLAAHLAVGAVRSYRATPATTRSATSNPTPTRAYLSLLGATLANPATVVKFAALVLGARAGSAVSLADQLVFVVAAFAASASWQLLLASSGARPDRSAGAPGHGSDLQRHHRDLGRARPARQLTRIRPSGLCRRCTARPARSRTLSPCGAPGRRQQRNRWVDTSAKTLGPPSAPVELGEMAQGFG